MKALQVIRRISGTALITLTVGLGSAWSILGQGLVEFTSLPELGNAPVYDVDGVTPLAGPESMAELYAAAPGSSLQPVGFPIPFSTAFPGYFIGPWLAVPGVPVGGTALVQVVAWRASDGATFEAANHPGGHVSESLVFSVGPLGNPGPPGTPLAPELTGLQSFSLYVVVPEPSVFAFGLLGGAALALSRRERRSCDAAKPKRALP